MCVRGGRSPREVTCPTTTRRGGRPNVPGARTCLPDVHDPLTWIPRPVAGIRQSDRCEVRFRNLAAAAKVAAVPGPPTRRAPIAELGALMIVLVAAGALIASGVLRADRRAPAGSTPHGTFAISDDVPTSFGAVAVESVKRIDGLTHRQLSGVSHGIQSLVPRGRVQVEVNATLTNLSRGVHGYAPEQFRLVEARGARPAPGALRRAMTGTSIHRGTLQPSAAIDARLTFVVPRNGRRLFLEYRDPSGGPAIAIDL